MNDVRMNFKWCRNTNPNRLGEYYLKLRIKISHNEFWIPVMYLDKTKWDKLREVVLPTHSDHILLNSRLINIKKEYGDFMLKMIGNKGFVTIDDFKRFYKGQSKYDDTFNTYFKCLMLKERTLAGSSINNMMTTLKKLNQFNPNIQFADLTPTLIREFNNSMSDLSLNTKNQMHMRLRRIITMAIQDKIITDNPYQHFKPKTKKVVREYLLDDELAKLENAELSGTPKTVRDMFLFASYTGLRVSDVLTLNASHLRQIGSETYLIKEMVKTKKTVKLPLDSLFGGKPLKILAEYPDFVPKDLNNKRLIWC